jgi:hypothetical protein
MGLRLEYIYFAITIVAAIVACISANEVREVSLEPQAEVASKFSDPQIDANSTIGIRKA